MVGAKPETWIFIGEVTSQKMMRSGNMQVTFQVPWRYHDRVANLIKWVGTRLEIEVRAGRHRK